MARGVKDYAENGDATPYYWFCSAAITKMVIDFVLPPIKKVTADLEVEERITFLHSFLIG